MSGSVGTACPRLCPFNGHSTSAACTSCGKDRAAHSLPANGSGMEFSPWQQEATQISCPPTRSASAAQLTPDCLFAAKIAADICCFVMPDRLSPPAIREDFRLFVAARDLFPTKRCRLSPSVQVSLLLGGGGRSLGAGGTSRFFSAAPTAAASAAAVYGLGSQPSPGGVPRPLVSGAAWPLDRIALCFG